jgi:3-hydroxyacyl-[acyl-carrier-protein] dehydratase
METLNKDQIKQFMPHREPMLLIDEAYIDDEGLAHGKYTVKQDEFFTRGHFPWEPDCPWRNPM